MSNNTPSAIAAAATTLLAQYQGELDDAGAAGERVRTALMGVAETCTKLQNSKAKAATVLADPRLSAQARAGDARALVSAAIDAAKTAGQAYSSALETSQAQLQGKLVPALPANTDGAVVAFRAGETTKLLEGAGNGSSVVRVAGDLLATALAQGDAVKAAILADGKILSDTYARLGVDSVALQATFARVLGQRSGTGAPVPGAKLYALLAAGGTGTLRGFRDQVGILMFSEQANFDRSLSGYLAITGADPSRYSVQR